jgi:transcriptional regulator with XRE-family HTH domain
MPQTPRMLTPHVSGRHFLGAELRCWRQRCGLSLAELARAVFVSADLLTKIEKADRAPSLDIIERCDDALNTGGALVRLFNFVEHQAAMQPAPAPLPSASPVVVKIVAEIVASGAVETEAARPAVHHGGARLYSLPRARNR